MANSQKWPKSQKCEKCQKMTQNDNFFFLAYSYIFCSDMISEQLAAYRIEKYAKTWKLWPILQNGQNHKSSPAAYLGKMSKNDPIRQLFFLAYS